MSIMSPIPPSPARFAATGLPRTRLGTAVVAASLMAILIMPGGDLRAQAVSPAAADTGDTTPLPPVTTAEENDEIVELNPFIVMGGEDRGYQAQNSLGGSRLKSDLKDIASPTSSFTEQFMEDLAISNVDDLAKYMLSTEFDSAEDNGNGQNNANGTNRPLRMRGLSMSRTINFFKSSFATDRFSVERYDQTRGPNAVLFGVGSPGGIVNATTKRAILRKQSTQILVRAQSYDGMRYEVDFNQPLVKDKLAFRVAGMKSQEESWRNNEYNDQQRYFGTLKWRIGHKTELNVEGETGTIDKLTTRNIIAFDAYTNWVAAGSHLSATANADLAIANYANNWIILDTSTGVLANWRGKTRSLGRTSSDGDNLPIMDFDLIPKETTIYGSGYGTHEQYSRIAATLTHSFTRNWHMEISAMRLDIHTEVWDPQTAAGRFIYADTNATLPDGSPNPNAGRPYIESVQLVNRPNNRDDAVRVMMTYTKDLKKWGRHTVAASFEYNHGILDRETLREYITSPSQPNTASDSNAQNRVWRRTYLGRQLEDGSWTLSGVPSSSIRMSDWRKYPVSGLTDASTTVTGGRTYLTELIPFNENTQHNSYYGTSTIAMLQSTFWKKRIHTVIGISNDTRSDRTVDVANPDWRINKSPEAQSYSGSIVYHATNWLSLTYSKAQNKALPSFSGRRWSDDGTVRGVRPPVAEGKSDDIGMKFDLFNRKLFATVTWFRTSSDNDWRFTPVITSVINPIWNTYINNPDGYNLPETPPNGYASYDDLLDDTTGGTYSNETKGIELELTANPTNNLRMYLNYSYQVTKSKNIAPEMLAYVSNWREFWLENAEVPLANGNGTIGSQVAAVDNAILSNYILAENREPVGQMRHKLRFTANYSFSYGVLKGVSAGLTGRYDSKPVAGYDRYLDGDGNRISNVRWGKDRTTIDLQLNYARKITLLKKSVMWSVQLKVDNVFNDDEVYPMRITLDGQVSMYKFADPRSVTVTTRFRF